jgi:hypothetical protein
VIQVTIRGPLVAALALTVALPPGAAAQGDLDANCPGPREMSFASMGGGNSRVAQTFTAGITGGLTVATVDVTKSGTAGDYRLDINEVDGSGVPTNDVIASTTISDAAVPAGTSLVSGSFAIPAQVTAGQQYALIITRPGSSGLGWGTRLGNDCPGGMFFANTQTSPLNTLGDTYDLVFEVFVLESDPPDTTITRRPTSRTRKRRASFEFGSDEPGSTFLCSLDAGPPAPCASPQAYVKLKRKRHAFTVVATDAAGNTDPTAASVIWRVKKKKRQR